VPRQHLISGTAAGLPLLLGVALHWRSLLNAAGKELH
jgi:hypothetical protein